MSGKKIETSPSLPWQISLYLFFAIDAPRRSNGTVNRFIANLVDFKASPSPTKPINGVTTTDITVDSSRNLWFRLFTPTHSDDVSLPVIVYFHGGGFAFFAANSKLYDDFCRRLAGELTAIVVSVNYRLSPENRFPCQYDDCFDVLKFIDQRNSSNLPATADLSRCILAGDSAGGNLAHHVAVRAGEYEFKEVNIAGLVAIQPFFGGEERTESEIRHFEGPFLSVECADWFWKSFLPAGSDRDHPMVNVSGPKSVDILGTKYPSTLVLVGGFDPLQDWQRRYYKELKRCGKQAYLIEYPNATHGFYGFPELPESSLLIKDVRDFMQKLQVRPKFSS